MPISLSEYRAKLTTQILFAFSQEEVKGFVDAALKLMEQQNRKDSAIALFTDEILGEFELYNPMEEDAQQWSNIKYAMILFNRIKNNYRTHIY